MKHKSFPLDLVLLGNITLNTNIPHGFASYLHIYESRTPYNNWHEGESACNRPQLQVPSALRRYDEMTTSHHSVVMINHHNVRCTTEAHHTFILQYFIIPVYLYFRPMR